MNETPIRRNAIMLLVLIFSWRVYLSATLQLHPDEAYYWMWSRHLDIGYFDHPPMVAYFIWLGTLVSQSELWVRMPATLVMLLVSGLMWHLCMQLFQNVRVAAGSVILFNLYPLTMLGMVVITPDVPVLLFWSLGVYLFWQIMHSGRVWLWYALGLCVGLALLSKYTAVLMPLCILLYLAFTDKRRWLYTVHPYLAGLLALACFFPVILWNYRNDWVSFLFQIRNGLGKEGLDATQLAQYVTGQLLVVGPLVWLTGTAATLRACRQQAPQSLLLVGLSVPVIVFFGLSALKKLPGPNWPAFAYFALSILVAEYSLHGHSRIRRAWWTACCTVSLSLALIATLQAHFGVLALQRHAPDLAASDATNAFYGWRELGDALKTLAPGAIAITASHQLGAVTRYYTEGHLSTTTENPARPSQFDLLTTADPHHRTARIYVWADNDLPGFDTTRLDAPLLLHVYRHGRVLRTYYLAWGNTNTGPRLLR